MEHCCSCPSKGYRKASSCIFNGITYKNIIFPEANNIYPKYFLVAGTTIENIFKDQYIENYDFNIKSFYEASYTNNRTFIILLILLTLGFKTLKLVIS